MRLLTCEPPLAKLWELHSVYSYKHVQDLLEVLDAKEELMDLARKESDRARRKEQEQNANKSNGRGK